MLPGFPLSLPYLFQSFPPLIGSDFEVLCARFEKGLADDSLSLVSESSSLAGWSSPLASRHGRRNGRRVVAAQDSRIDPSRLATEKEEENLAAATADSFED